MSISEQAQVGDIGTKIRLTVYDSENPADISNAVTKSISFKPKNGGVITKIAEFVTDGTDGKIECTISEDDFELAGTYSVQGYISTPSGSWHTSIKQMTINKNL